MKPRTIFNAPRFVILVAESVTIKAVALPGLMPSIRHHIAKRIVVLLAYYAISRLLTQAATVLSDAPPLNRWPAIQVVSLPTRSRMPLSL